MVKKQAKKKAAVRAVRTPKNSVADVRRVYIRQSDIPSASLEDALRVPNAILDHYAGKPTSPLHVAKALNIDPNGSQIRVLTGASIAFGLTEGGAQAATISVTDVARRALRPKSEGDDVIAKREAVLNPRIFGEFLRRYDSSPFPRKDLAINVLEEMGVPRNKASEVLERIESSARTVGFVELIKDKAYVSLHGAHPHHIPQEEIGSMEGFVDPRPQDRPYEIAQGTVEKVENFSSYPVAPSSMATAIADDERRRKVFITHGKSRDLVDPIKKLLEFGELIPVVSVERQSVSKPVPEKVMDDMRACGAAIIHVDADRSVVDKEGNETVILNPNVLIEIGAAMAFYGRRFILLVRDGVKLPSNLQGLYEVRYAGETIDANATIKLLEAIKDIKNYALPTEVTNL